MRLYTKTKRLRFLLILACTCVLNLATAQVPQYKKGIQLFETGEYDAAIKELINLKDIPAAQQGKWYYTIAEAYRLSNRISISTGFYEKAIAAKVPNPDARYFWAEGLKAQGKYNEAQAQLQTLLKTKGLSKNLQQKTNREIATLKGIEALIEKTKKEVAIEPIALNTAGSDYGVAINNGWIVFSSTQKTPIYSNGLPYSGLYKVPVKSPSDAPVVFDQRLFEPDRNEASIAFNPEQDIAVFAKGNSGKKKDLTPNVDLYMSRKIAGLWSVPEMLAFSDSLAWDGSPAFSQDGKTLYFASNRIGGQGGIDLWQASFDGAKFSKIKNLGKTYNTSANEMFPYEAPDGTFYFSSNGHPGMGRLDIFSVAKIRGGRINIENMGTPFNSAADDFGVYVYQDQIYFCSDRDGGKGADDIYVTSKKQLEAFVENKKIEEKKKLEEIKAREAELAAQKKIEIVPKVVNYLLAGTVRDGKDPLENTKVIIADAENGKPLREFVTGKNGRYGPVKIDIETDYVVLFEKDKYLKKRELLNTQNMEIPAERLVKSVTDTLVFVNANLERIVLNKAIKLENIYYDLDKSDIREDAAEELDKLVEVLEDNPGIKIELGSHTDSRSSDIYNLRLSQRRAEAAVFYIVSKGIDPERIRAKGYGEGQLIIKNAKTEEQHQINRRTEFKIVELADGTTEEDEN